MAAGDQLFECPRTGPRLPRSRGAYRPGGAALVLSTGASTHRQYTARDSSVAYTHMGNANRMISRRTCDGASAASRHAARVARRRRGQCGQATEATMSRRAGSPGPEASRPRFSAARACESPPFPRADRSHAGHASGPRPRRDAAVDQGRSRGCRSHRVLRGRCARRSTTPPTAEHQRRIARRDRRPAGLESEDGLPGPLPFNG